MLNRTHYSHCTHTTLHHNHTVHHTGSTQYLHSTPHIHNGFYYLNKQPHTHNDTLKATVTNPKCRVEKLSPKKSPEDSHTVPKGLLRRQFFLPVFTICHSWSYSPHTSHTLILHTSHYPDTTHCKRHSPPSVPLHRRRAVLDRPGWVQWGEPCPPQSCPPPSPGQTLLHLTGETME